MPPTGLATSARSSKAGSFTTGPDGAAGAAGFFASATGAGVGAAALGWDGPYARVQHAEEAVAAAVSVGSGALAWLTNTLGSAIAGLIVGAVVVLIMHLIPRRKDAANAAH